MMFPSSWKRIAIDDGGPTVFRNPDDTFQATITTVNSVLGPDLGINRGEFESFVAIRVQTEVQVSGPQTTISRSEYTELQDGVYAATFEGNRESDFWTKTKMVLTKRLLLIVYVEMIGSDKELLDSVSRDLFDTISMDGE